MKKITYYVACSIDGFISGKNDDISGFVGEGKGVQKYLNDLKHFETVIMGRNTYEFGYKYGMKPGDPAYPHMNHFIFSKTLNLESKAGNINIVNTYDLEKIEKIKLDSKTDVYLCGGGKFAKWLLENEKIDILKLKINPLILGEGTKLFGDSKKNYKLNLLDSETFENGLLINSYQIEY